tara:strand:+ start:378 stop:815 length:438 start_codon:yes stop_codon:yes gene_type:complete
VKKKITASSQDKKDWISFTKKMENISVKEIDLNQDNKVMAKIPKLDLHGLSLTDANNKAKKFIIESFDQGYRKLLIVTGKGSRSKSYDNPYLSEKLSILKYSLPEYINRDENLNSKISKISEADRKDGGDGAIYIFLKNTKRLTK